MARRKKASVIGAGIQAIRNVSSPEVIERLKIWAILFLAAGGLYIVDTLTQNSTGSWIIGFGAIGVFSYAAFKSSRK